MQYTIYGPEFVMFSAVARDAWHCPLHAHECFELLYVLEGRCRIVTHDGTHIAQPHDLVLFRPYQWHEETLLTKCYAVFCLRFPHEFVTEHQVPLPDPTVLPTVTPLPHSEMFQTILNRIISEYRRHDSYAAAMIGTYLFQFAVMLQRELQQQSMDRAYLQPQAAALQHILDQHITSTVSIHDLARQVHMSESHFSHQVKTLLGVPPQTYVRERRLARAQELLQSSSMTIEEIAIVLGYNEPTSFFRAFKRATGLTPGQFRQRVDSIPIWTTTVHH